MLNQTNKKQQQQQNIQAYQELWIYESLFLYILMTLTKLESVTAGTMNGSNDILFKTQKEQRFI
jgi:hypothetical protein